MISYENVKKLLVAYENIKADGITYLEEYK